MSDTQMDGIFQGLKAVVQYRHKHSNGGWSTMAAYDSHERADRYVAKYGEGYDNWLWEYRVVDVEPRD